MPEEEHAKQLTREHVTSAVHYLRFELDPSQIERMAEGPVVLRLDHEPELGHTLPDDVGAAATVEEAGPA